METTSHQVPIKAHEGLGRPPPLIRGVGHWAQPFQ